MKAVFMVKEGGPEVLKTREVPEPEIQEATDVKIKIHAAGINPVDTKIRTRGLLQAGPLPAILGLDGAGEVVATGSEVCRFKPGDRVWYCHGGLGNEQGNYAQVNVIPERYLAPMPDVDFIQAAAGPLVLITAWEALFDRGGLQSGETVLIHAGAGGVGHVAIQLAKLAGAKVLTTVGSAANAEWVGALGADDAIQYKEQDVTEAVKDATGGQGADLVLDTVGGGVFQDAMAMTAHYGRLVTLLQPGPDCQWNEARNRNLQVGFVLMLTPLLHHLESARAHQIAILERCRKRIDNGELKLHIHQHYVLEDAVPAHNDMNHSKQGKLVFDTTS